MSQSAISIPAMAPWPTVPSMPWPIIAVIIFPHSLGASAGARVEGRVVGLEGRGLSPLDEPRVLTHQDVREVFLHNHTPPLAGQSPGRPQQALG